MSGSENGQSTLLLWLNLLGWRVDVRRKGDELVGVARHIAADGTRFRVGGHAGTRDELAYQLFQAALACVEGRESSRRLLAA